MFEFENINTEKQKRIFILSAQVDEHIDYLFDVQSYLTKKNQIIKIEMNEEDMETVRKVSEETAKNRHGEKHQKEDIAGNLGIRFYNGFLSEYAIAKSIGRGFSIETDKNKSSFSYFVPDLLDMGILAGVKSFTFSEKSYNYNWKPYPLVNITTDIETKEVKSLTEGQIITYIDKTNPKKHVVEIWGYAPPSLLAKNLNITKSVPLCGDYARNNPKSISSRKVPFILFDELIPIPKLKNSDNEIDEEGFNQIVLDSIREYKEVKDQVLQNIKLAQPEIFEEFSVKLNKDIILNEFDNFMEMKRKAREIF